MRKIYGSLLMLISLYWLILPALSMASEVTDDPQQEHQTAAATKHKAPSSDTEKADLLEERLQEEAKKQEEGLIISVMKGLTVLYTITVNLFLFPIFAFLFFVSFILMIILSGKVWAKYKEDDLLGAKRWWLYWLFNSLILLNIVLIIYGKREAVLLFITFQKELGLMLAAAIIGFLLGKLASKKSFEEERIP